MRRFKQFLHKEQAGLEGRVIDIGNFKVQIRNPIAEGGFSCVYLAQDALHGFKQYALKHIICNDEESQELVIKEISVMKALKGHPNIVTLYAHAVLDMGRTKEAFLLMEYCEKSLVNVLESRGAGFFEEKQVLAIFRDVCNAVFAMHCQTPPIAHRDLKAENLLVGSDGPWKLCDFGSTSTNHKRFEKPEEMGIEEDNIRKHTTPAYRAPEMWDLFRKEVINEKVDIWALGCLLFRICYLKPAFDGESKLQILNGNYRIPDLPKYNPLLTDLIRDMLQSSPVDRPDITQVWFCVNNLLPNGMHKSLPDTPPEILKLTKGLNLFPENSNQKTERLKQPKTEESPMKEEKLEAEAEKLRDQLAHASAEKAEIISRYEKLSAICKSQRQEIQDLNNALAAKTTPSPTRDSSTNLPSPVPNSQQWQAFADNPKPQTLPTNVVPKSVRTKKTGQQINNSNNNKAAADTFKVNVPSARESKSSGSKLEAQPAGWAGF